MHRRLVCESIFDVVGRTPLVRAERLEKDVPGIELYLKLEFTNPGGSVKDRPASNMIREAENAGLLKIGMTIIDSTSGNTGVALALYGAARGYNVVLVMPENVSTARKNMLRAFGAEIVYSDPMEGSDGAIRLVQKLVAENPGKYFYTNQYANPANWQAHVVGTAEEIWEDTKGRVTHFVAGIGTSGTVMGTGRGLKAKNPNIIVVGVEPDDEFHGLEGLKHIKTSIVPPIYDASVLNETMFLETEAGWSMSERLAREEGLLAGHSGGAVVEAALRIARRLRKNDETGVIVAILPDHSARYVELR